MLRRVLAECDACVQSSELDAILSVSLAYATALTLQAKESSPSTRRKSLFKSRDLDYLCEQLKYLWSKFGEVQQPEPKPVTHLEGRSFPCEAWLGL